MLASNTCHGSRTRARATHATFQMENCPSPLSTRPTLPGWRASGNVKRTASAPNPSSTIASSRLPETITPGEYINCTRFAGSSQYVTSLLGARDRCDRVFSLPRTRPSARSTLSRRLAGTDNQRMRARRYTVIVADRSSGVLRRLTVNLRTTIAGVCGVMMVPILIGLGARWSARTEISELRAVNSTLQVENASYRAATGEL